MQSRPQLKSFLEYINGSVLNEEYLNQIPPPLISSWYWGAGRGEGGRGGRRGGVLAADGGGSFLPEDSRASSIPKVCLGLSACSCLPSASLSGPILSFLCQFLSPSVGPFLIFTFSFSPFFLPDGSRCPLPPSRFPPSLLCLSLLLTLYPFMSLSVAVSEFWASVSGCLSLSFFSLSASHTLFLPQFLQLNALLLSTLLSSFLSLSVPFLPHLGLPLLLLLVPISTWLCCLLPPFP